MDKMAARSRLAMMADFAVDEAGTDGLRRRSKRMVDNPFAAYFSSDAAAMVEHTRR